jgi:hypothetical protein
VSHHGVVRDAQVWCAYVLQSVRIAAVRVADRV